SQRMSLRCARNRNRNNCSQGTRAASMEPRRRRDASPYPVAREQERRVKPEQRLGGASASAGSPSSPPERVRQSSGNGRANVRSGTTLLGSRTSAKVASLY